MPRLHVRSFALSTVLIAVTACQKREAPVSSSEPTAAATESPDVAQAKKEQPKLKAMMDKMPDIAKKASTEPPVKVSQPLATKLENAKFAIIGQKWVTEPFRDPAPDELDFDHSVFSICSSTATDEKLDAEDLKYMQECLAWEYLAVVRPRGVTMPKVKLAEKSFEAGSCTGDVLLFELKSGEVKGRYTMNITNSDEISNFQGSSDKDWQDQAKRDLLENVTGVIGERLRLERDSMGE